MENNQTGFKPQVITFVMVCFLMVLILLNKLVDLPHIIFKMEPGAVSWVEVGLQFIGVGVCVLVLHFLLKTADSEYHKVIEKVHTMEASRKLLSTILGDSPTAILFVKNEKPVWVSKTAVDLLGWPIEKWLSEPTLAFIFPSEEEYRRVNQERIFNSISARKRVTFEYDFVHKEGHRIGLLVILRAINKDSLEQGLIFSMVDNSESKKNQEMIKKLNEELEQKVKTRTLELKEKLDELERFREATISREFRIKELQDQIAVLKGKIEIR